MVRKAIKDLEKTKAAPRKAVRQPPILIPHAARYALDEVRCEKQLARRRLTRFGHSLQGGDPW